MGLREWLFKPYLEKLQEVNDKLQKLESQLMSIQSKLNDKADKGTLTLLHELVSNNGTSIKSLQREIENIRIEIEGLKAHFEMKQVEAKELTPEEAKALLLGLIKKGYHSPSELKQLTPLVWIRCTNS